MQTAPPPRLYGIHAAHAPIVAVFRRGPSNWWHILKWDYRAGVVERGAWLRGKLYPRRSSLSHDGMYLFTFILKHPGWIDMPNPYSGLNNLETRTTWSQVSKLPWLTALAAWAEMGTWTSGFWFAQANPEAQACWGEIGPPQHLALGNAPPLCLVQYSGQPLAVERSLGWRLEHNSETPEEVVICRPRPDSSATLFAQVAFNRVTGFDFYSNVYQLARDGREPEPLTDAAWADWAHDGRLLVATINGQLQVRSPSGDGWAVEWSMDTCGWKPDPQPSPEWARRW